MRSFVFEPADGGRYPHRPGQFTAVRLPDGDVRSYSLSAPGDGRRLRISVKRDGRVSSFLHDHVAAGATLELAAPRGTFVLDASDRTPAVFVSAGIGVTPVLAMLAALAEADDRRPVTWIHVARSSAEHAFAEPVRAWLHGLPSARAHVRFTQPLAGDRVGRDCDAVGRLTAADLAALELPGDAGGVPLRSGRVHGRDATRRSWTSASRGSGSTARRSAPPARRTACAPHGRPARPAPARR